MDELAVDEKADAFDTDGSGMEWQNPASPRASPRKPGNEFEESGRTLYAKHKSIDEVQKREDELKDIRKAFGECATSIRHEHCPGCCAAHSEIMCIDLALPFSVHLLYNSLFKLPGWCRF